MPATSGRPTALFMFERGWCVTQVRGLVQDVLLVFVQVHAVDRDGTRPQDAELLQALHHAQVVLAQALVLVGLVLGDVDVEAGAQPLDGSPAGFQRLVRDGERGVQPERRAQLRVACPGGSA